ncbi:hypothetical protein [Pararhizobium sp. PWRC1-1]|uniref:hypothetical protein n=1 Tax=Pararhizobium sp. PWRC1-1 TaxID=2804566 RepID=UPI003CFA5D81
MSTDDSNVTPEQKKPRDVHRSPGQPSHADERSKAPPMVQPAGEKDASEKPVVNPVTGGAI